MNDGVLELMKNFKRLPEKRQTEIFEMIERLTCIQMNEGGDAPDFVNTADTSLIKRAGNSGAKHAG
ncbi:MAG: hypothetical protein LBB83_02920 [Treponema sp.]|jgi:hypothetical protein|nr:hypothetical protein [Treponema sp.]